MDWMIFDRKTKKKSIFILKIESFHIFQYLTHTHTRAHTHHNQNGTDDGTLNINYDEKKIIYKNLTTKKKYCQNE